MSFQKESSSLSPSIVLSVFCLLLYSAGFIRIEVKINDQEHRLTAVEQSLASIRQGISDASLKGKLKTFFI